MGVKSLDMMPSDQIKAGNRTGVVGVGTWHSMHTQDNEVQFAATITAVTTEVEKKNKDTSGKATENLKNRRDMSFAVQRCGWWGGGGGKQHSAQNSCIGFEVLRGAPVVLRL